MRMRLLFLSRWYPYPPDNGSKLRVFSLLRGLCEQHDVTLISFFDPSEVREEPALSSAAPRETRLCAYRPFDASSVRAITGVLSRRPRFLVDTRSHEMERLIRGAVAGASFDLVVASQLPMAAYYRCFPGLRAIFEEVELGIYRARGDRSGLSFRSRARGQLTWLKHRAFVSQLLRNYVLCTVASEEERQLLGAAVPDYRSVHIVPNCVDAEPLLAGRPARDQASLIFTGSLRYRPNYDAMVWFLKDIFPTVRCRARRVRLTITGEPGPPLPSTAGDVVMTGWVRDVRPFLAASTISIAPVRTGGGTRLKILEAMAVRTPVVATSKAVEGLGLRDGEHVLIADEPTTALDVDLGSVKLTAWDQNQIEIYARVEPPQDVTSEYAARAVEAAKIEVTGDGRSLTIRSDFSNVPAMEWTAGTWSTSSKTKPPFYVLHGDLSAGFLALPIAHQASHCRKFHFHLQPPNAAKMPYL